MKRLFKKLTIRIILAFLAIIVVAVPLIYLTVLNQREASAAWFDDNFAFRKVITLTNTTAEANKYATLANYDASDTTKYQTDCGDVRFTKQNGDLLPYTVDACDSTTNFRIEFDTLAASSTQTVYIYFGNPTVSNGFMPADQVSACADCTFGTPASEEKGPGPVAYWKFDDATGTNAQDSTVNNNDGTITGATWKTEDNCISGKCLAFDGTDDYISTSSNSGISGNAALTLAGWVYLNNTSSGQTAVFIGNSTISLAGAGMYFNINGAGSVSAEFAGGNGARTAAGVVSASGWYHVAITKTAGAINTTTTIYVNGTPRTISTASSNTPNITNATPVIGQFGSSGSFFNGQIDEVKIYPYARSAAQVLADYNSRGTVKGASVNLGNIASNVGVGNSGPVGYWKFDEKTGTTAYDRGTGANNGTLTSGPTWVAGKFGQAIDFDGSDDVVTKSSPGNLPTGAMARTISAWIKPDNTNPGGTVVHYGNEAAAGQEFVVAQITLSGTTYIFTDGVNVNNNIAISGSEIPSNNVWSYISFTFDGGSAWKYYINGVLIKSGTFATAINTATPTILNIGDRTDSAQTNFPGLIDDVKIYNYARTAGQIVEDMNAGHPAPGSPVGSALAWWKFDEGADNTCSGGTNDACNYGNTGTTLDGPFSGNTTYTNSGKFGKATTYDGTGDYIAIPDNNALDLTTSGSVGGWFKLNATTDEQTLAIKSTNGSTDVSYGLYIDNAGSGPYFRFFIDNDGGWGPDVLVDTSIVTTATWYHVVGTWDATGTKIYLNGNLSGSSTSTVTVLTNSSPLHVGANVGNGWIGFNGTMDELKIYNSALTADQVKQDMNRGQAQILGALSDNSTYQKNAANQEYCVPGDSTSCAAPVGEWKMDEKVGTTANDTSGNANTGTLTLGPTWTQGKMGAAVKFDGTNDYINVADSASLDVTNMTMSLWFKPTITLDSSTGRRDLMRKYIAYWLIHNWSVADGKISFTLDAGTPTVTTTTTSWTAGKWYHIAATHDGSNMRIYVNGVLEGTTATTNLPDVSTSNLNIGADSTGGFYFPGIIDEAKVYNYARSAAQIAWDYNRGGPVGWWKFDECQGTTANDASGNANNGTITVGASGTYTSVGTCPVSSASSMWYNGATGKRNYSLAFDGTDDYVTANGVVAKLTGSGFSFGGWMKPSANQRGAPVSFHSSGGGNLNMIFWGQTSNKFSYYDDSISYNDINSTLATGTWYHLFVTIDSSNNGTLYINGIAEKTFTTSVRPATDGKFSIGQEWDGGSPTDFFNGQVDDVRVYNYGLTAAQVKTVMNDGAVRFGPVLGAP